MFFVLRKKLVLQFTHFYIALVTKMNSESTAKEAAEYVINQLK